MTGPIAVLGSGAWGTALAAHLRRGGEEVRQWVREPEVVEQIAACENRAFLAGIELPPGIEATPDPGVAVAGARMVFAVVPCQFAREVYRRIASFLAPGTPVIAAAKGIEEASLMLPCGVIEDELGGSVLHAALSGPSFAADVAQGKPTALVAAAAAGELAHRLQELLATTALRVYTNDDPVGVQLGGALKNVIALAAGIVDGLGAGPNARAALITRGLAEMTRLGVKLGGRPETFAGLAGLGDLVLTCTDAQSRNFSVGRRLGRGESLEQILAGARSVAEGVRTTEAAYRLARRETVRMPIVDEIHDVLYERGDPREAVERLMARPLTSENEPRELPRR